MLTVGSLCSGYGGLDLAVEAVFGARTVWHAEVETAPSSVLAARWPGVPNLGNVKLINWKRVPPVDIVTAGYPCQPDSDAGKRLSEDDPRWIFPDIARGIGVLRPRLVVLENVRGHFVRGFRTVLGYLADLGYDAQWTLVRASDVGAPHRRERLFVVANPEGEPWGVGHGNDVRARWGTDERGQAAGPRAAAFAENFGHEWAGPARQRGDGSPNGGATDTDTAFERSRAARGYDGVRTAGLESGHIQWGQYTAAIRRWERAVGRLAPAPTQSCRRGGQQLAPRFVEWMQGLLDGWVTDVPGISRNKQLKMLGNGVVPQQAEHALRLLIDVPSLAVSS